MRLLVVLAAAALMALMWAQDKSAPPKPPAEAPKEPATKQGEPPKSGSDPIDQRRERMKQRDGEIDKMMKQKAKK